MSYLVNAVENYDPSSVCVCVCVCVYLFLYMHITGNEVRTLDILECFCLRKVHKSSQTKYKSERKKLTVRIKKNNNEF